MAEEKFVPNASVGSSKESAFKNQSLLDAIFKLVIPWLGCLHWSYWWLFHDDSSFFISKCAI